VEETKSKLNTFQQQDLKTKMNKSNDMDFATFTNYMLKYEDLKQQFNRQKKQEEEEKRREKQAEKPSNIFPDHYPTHLLYGRKKTRNNIFY